MIVLLTGKEYDISDITQNRDRIITDKHDR